MRRTMRCCVNVLMSLLIAVVIVGLDQFSKYCIRQSFELGEGVAVLPFLNVIHTENRGAAFSFLTQAGGWQTILFIVIACVVSVYVIYWIMVTDPKERLTRVALNGVLGGAIGNLIDRVWFGQVTDFIDFHIKGWHFAVFNVADSAITVGIGLLLVTVLREHYCENTISQS